MFHFHLHGPVTMHVKHDDVELLRKLDVIAGNLITLKQNGAIMAGTLKDVVDIAKQLVDASAATKTAVDAIGPLIASVGDAVNALEAAITNAGGSGPEIDAALADLHTALDSVTAAGASAGTAAAAATAVQVDATDGVDEAAPPATPPAPPAPPPGDVPAL